MPLPNTVIVQFTYGSGSIRSAENHHACLGWRTEEQGPGKGREDHIWALTAHGGGTSHAGSAAEATPKIRAAAATGRRDVKRMLTVFDNWYCRTVWIGQATEEKAVTSKDRESEVNGIYLLSAFAPWALCFPVALALEIAI